MNSRDLAKLRQTYQVNTYYPADLTWKNVKVRNVGIRSRGAGSRNPTKLGLRVDMDRYTTGQKFVGLSTIILDNIWQDDSMIREKLAFTFFEKLGQPAPRESYCRLFINNEYQGLYTITEEIDGAFAQRVTGETDGTVFEFHADNARPYRAEDLGAIENYKPFFEPRTHVLDADTTLYTPIQQLFREANGPDDAVWRSRVEQYLDLNSFMVHVGIEQFMAGNDGILGAFGMNNFYLYRFQGSQKHRLFVWDQDNAFIVLRQRHRDHRCQRPVPAGDDLSRPSGDLPQDDRGLRDPVQDRRLAADRDRSPDRHHLRRGARRHEEAIQQRGVRRGGRLPACVRRREAEPGPRRGRSTPEMN